MTEEQEKEIRNIVSVAVKKTVIKFMSESEEEQQHREEKENYRVRKEFIKHLLESYREEGLGSTTRKTVNHFLNLHKKAASNDTLSRKRHNLIVLRYVIGGPLAKKEICRKVGLTECAFENQTEKAIEELAVHAFGVYGINFHD